MFNQCVWDQKGFHTAPGVGEIYLLFWKGTPWLFLMLCDRNFDEMASVYWLTKGDLSAESEGFLLAAQDQALYARVLQNVFSHSASSQCQLCNSQGETVEHLVSGCTQLAGTQYKTRHSNVGKFDMQREHHWWRYNPDSVMENDYAKIL